ncbi:hypothetical protein WTH01_17870 [Weissella thailandensis]|nr:hypothetical protein WTH01_17870 [Weissella thailandensis]
MLKTLKIDRFNILILLVLFTYVKLKFNECYFELLSMLTIQTDNGGLLHIKSTLYNSYSVINYQFQKDKSTNW